MKRALLALALALAALPLNAAEAAKYAMLVTPTGNQSMRMQNGAASIDSYAEGSSVRFVRTETPIKKRASIQILVMNHGEQPFNVGPENVRAQLADGTPVAIITYDQLVREEKRRRTWRAIGAGLAAAGNAMSASNAGYTSGTVSYRGSSYGSVGTTPYHSTTYGTATYSGYDQGRAQAAQAVAQEQNRQMFAGLAARNAQSMAALGENMRTTTVDPGQLFGGSVMFELPRNARSGKADVPVTFIVSAGSEEHRFEVTLQRM